MSDTDRRDRMTYTLPEASRPRCSKPHKLHVEDLAAIERAGITLGIEVAYTRRRP